MFCHTCPFFFSNYIKDMPKITYIEDNGSSHTKEVANGLSVMEGAVQNDIPGIDADSLTYWIAAYQMEMGEMPLFNIRTPLYPIYMYFMRSITDGAMTGIAIQMIATFFVHFFLLNSVYKYFKRLFIPLGIIVSSMVFLDFSIRYDTNYLGEVFYINGVVLYFTLILRAIFNEDKSLKFWMFSSIIIGINKNFSFII